MSAPACALALDIGGTKIHAGLVRITPATASHGESAEILGSVLRAPTPASKGAEAVLAQAAQLAAQAREALPQERPSAVGIASAGVIDAATGCVTHATDALPGWPGTQLAPRLERALGLPARALNDVHAHGLGEALFGAGRGLRRVLTVAIGTGISGALVVDGEIDPGARGVAGHVGHLPCPEAGDLPCPCGRTGHLEAFASGPAIAAHHARRIGAAHATSTGPTTFELARAAAVGDPLAAETLRAAGFAAGRALGGLLNMLDPELIALTGGVTGSGQVWWDALREGVRHDAMDATAATPIVPAAAGVHAALLGAAGFALTAHARAR